MPPKPLFTFGIMNSIMRFGGCILAALFLACPVQGQFVSADSFGEFHVVAGPDNSQENTGVGVSGQFLWDSTNLYLRVIVTNLAGTPGHPDNGVLTSFGFQTPTVIPGTVQLAASGQADGGPALASMSFTLMENYQIFSFPSMGIGLAVNPASPQGGNPNLGLPAGRTAFFDFNFQGAGIAPADFSFEGFGYTPVPQDGDPFNIAFRFQGIGNGSNTEGSDGFAGYVVPEPSTYGIAGILLLGMLISERRRALARRRG